jgi:hypothetical protein
MVTVMGPIVPQTCRRRCGAQIDLAGAASPQITNLTLACVGRKIRRPEETAEIDAARILSAMVELIRR